MVRGRNGGVRHSIRRLRTSAGPGAPDPAAPPITDTPRGPAVLLRPVGRTETARVWLDSTADSRADISVLRPGAMRHGRAFSRARPIPLSWTTTKCGRAAPLATAAPGRRRRVGAIDPRARRSSAAGALRTVRHSAARTPGKAGAWRPAFRAIEDDNALIAYEADGEQLGLEHGWALRLAVPSRCFWKSAPSGCVAWSYGRRTSRALGSATATTTPISGKRSATACDAESLERGIEEGARPSIQSPHRSHT